MIEDYISLHAEAMPDKVAIVSGSQYVSYASLWQKVQERAAELRGNGLGQGSVAVMRTTQTIDFLISYFAVHLAGAVAMPLEKNTPEQRFVELCSRFAGFNPPEGVADILFTTGTTGNSKGVMISHDTIVADAENLIEAHGYTRQTVFVVCGPLNHIGSLSKIYPVLMQGATLIILDGMRNLEEFFQAMDFPSDKMATFLVPANVRMLLMLAKKRLASLADKIDFIESGAAPLSHADMKSLCGIIATYNYNDGRCQAGCMGHPMKHAGVRIDSDGRIVCRGRTLMTGYAYDFDMTSQILRDGELYTADLGQIDENGMLHLVGRMDDVINVGGFKVDPVEVENVAMELPQVADCICVQVEHPVAGMALKLIVVMRDGESMDRKTMS